MQRIVRSGLQRGLAALKVRVRLWELIGQGPMETSIPWARRTRFLRLGVLVSVVGVVVRVLGEDRITLEGH